MRPGPPERSNTGLMVVAIVSVVALLGAVAWFSLGGDDDRPTNTASSGTGTPFDASGSALAGSTDAQGNGLAISPAGTVACTQFDPGALHPSGTSDDLVATTRQGLAPRPFDGQASGPSAVSSDYPTPTSFLAQSNVPDPEARQQVMVDAGYRDGIESKFAAEKPYDIGVLAFRDAAATQDYLRARMSNLCRQRGTEALLPLGDDGFAFVDELGGIHGDFILGGHQVSLTICGCVPDEGLPAMQAWYLAWLATYGDSSTS